MRYLPVLFLVWLAGALFLRTFTQMTLILLWLLTILLVCGITWFFA
jgi:hypothetical protein